MRQSGDDHSETNVIVLTHPFHIETLQWRNLDKIFELCLIYKDYLSGILFLIDECGF